MTMYDEDDYYDKWSDDYHVERLAPFSCTMCGSRNWPNPHSSCPLCRGDEDEYSES